MARYVRGCIRVRFDRLTLRVTDSICAPRVERVAVGELPGLENERWSVGQRIENGLLQRLT